MARNTFEIERAPPSDAALARVEARSPSDLDELGCSLRELYEGVVAQPLPASFLSLLSRLDAGDGEGRRSR